MNKTLIVMIILLSAAYGCTSNSHVYRNQPLVAKVETGMTQDQVRQIGGEPLSVTPRTVELGTCFDYVLTQAGHKQPFNVSFDGNGKVDHTSFLTCAEWSHAQQKARAPGSGTSDMGGGY
ncbi:osmotically inducible lipoprotein OsmE [Pseudomonas chlororaphis subsp. aureofaciens]|uniref:osmotically-inducible lipoprotein OsmE n=1 Tax=Pseudomonas chlororaphis TaxID=587753 RepID=UPI000F583F14|nr:osmotically-inducible lipoprotein OsmE [Pseudomonas chlororaphis]AZE11810.1 osmotically inducible lipoprotein OsmE [Pseudomonas chlororaphis subsp. aureofaciens]